MAGEAYGAISSLGTRGILAQTFCSVPALIQSASDGLVSLLGERETGARRSLPHPSSATSPLIAALAHSHNKRMQAADRQRRTHSSSGLVRQTRAEGSGGVSFAAFAGQLEPMPCKLPPTSCCAPERQPRLLIVCLFCQLIALRGTVSAFFCRL